MKKRFVIFAAVVALALALSVTAFALTGSNTALIHSEYYSGKCYLTCEGNTATASMTAKRTKDGPVVFGAMAELKGTAYYVAENGKLGYASLDGQVELPTMLGESVSVKRTVSKPDNADVGSGPYTLIQASCTYTLTYFSDEKTLTIM